MKSSPFGARPLCIGLALLIGITANAQVVITFANLGPGWSRPIFGVDGITPLSPGSTYQVELTYDARPFGGSLYEVVGTPAAFVAPGLFADSTRTVGIDLTDPSNPATFNLVVQAWETTSGATFNDATIRGRSHAFPIPIPPASTGGAPEPLPLSMMGMNSFSLAVIPEPQHLAWISGGCLGVWLVLRRCLRVRHPTR